MYSRNPIIKTEHSSATGECETGDLMGYHSYNKSVNCVLNKKTKTRLWAGSCGYFPATHYLMALCDDYDKLLTRQFRKLTTGHKEMAINTRAACVFSGNITNDKRGRGYHSFMD